MTINDTIKFPTSVDNLSQALAGMTAQLAMPEQYARIMADTELSIRQQCKCSAHHIDK